MKELVVNMNWEKLRYITPKKNLPLHPYSQKLMASVPRLSGNQELEFIPGKPPSLIGLQPGCRFAPRCAMRFEKCDMNPPVIEKEGRLVKCWLHAEG